MQADLKAETPGSSSSGTQTQSPLEKLLAGISKSLNSGDTASALDLLACYLAGNGQTSGNAVNLTA